MSANLHTGEKTEIEAKFICPEGLDLDALLSAASTMGIQYSKEMPCFQTDVYLDTSDYTLLKAGAALRIRQRGENYVGTYKLSEKQQQESIFERREFDWILSSEAIKLWTNEKKPIIPAAIIEKLHLQGQLLRKVLVVETHRHTAILSDNDGFKAELALDEVTFRGHKGQKSYREIEVELLNGQREHFGQITNSLQNHLKLHPSIDSKYKKGMMLVGKYGVGTPYTVLYKGSVK